jgi:hypothetical protein
MAKIQGYFENNKPEHYEEGPWILCGPFPDGTYRVERFLPGSPCSVMDVNVVERGRLERMAPIVDRLNFVEEREEMK